MEGVSRADVCRCEAGAQGVHVEEGVFSMLDAGDWGAIQALVSLVANSRQVHIGLLVRNLNALESTS